MLSAIVLSPAPSAAEPRQAAGRVLRTLAALVPPTIDGVIRDVTLVQVGRSEPVARIADEAGCLLVEAEDFATAVGGGARGVRGPWVLLIVGGAQPGRGFGDEAATAIERLGAGDSLALRAEAGGLGRLVPAFAPAVGLIVTRQRLAEHLAAGPCRSFAALVGRIRPRRSLATRIPLLP